jgi:hypothetical protein
MNEKQTSKKIENYIELRKNLWATAIVLTGGIITILLNLDSLLKLGLVIVGVGVDIIFINLIIEINKDINKLIKKIGG